MELMVMNGESILVAFPKFTSITCNPNAFNSSVTTLMHLGHTNF
ncbi:MAG: hypothetical protein Q7W13_02100 [Bacteroidia bacterium]|nr:hypothetical protein [Bacteroidia bacterium]